MKQTRPGKTAASRRAVAMLLLAVGVLGWTAQGAARADGHGGWTVAEASGKAWVSADGAGWTALEVGAAVAPGSRVRTGADGRLSLVRPGDSMAVSPNSRFEIPATAKTATAGHILQTLGTLLFKITTRPERPFNVRTPYLAAVIKGTTFTVSVDDGRSALHVAKGAVQVTSILSRESVLVRPGQTAAINGRNGGRMRLIGARRSRHGTGAKAAGKVASADPAAAGEARSGKAPPTARDRRGSAAAKSGKGRSKAAARRRGRAVETSRHGPVIARLLGVARINVFEVTKGLVNGADDRGEGARKGARGKSDGKGAKRGKDAKKASARERTDRKGSKKKGAREKVRGKDAKRLAKIRPGKGRRGGPDRLGGGRSAFLGRTGAAPSVAHKIGKISGDVGGKHKHKGKGKGKGKGKDD